MVVMMGIAVTERGVGGRRRSLPEGGIETVRSDLRRIGAPAGSHGLDETEASITANWAGAHSQLPFCWRV